MTEQALIECTRLTKDYGVLRALDSVSLDIRRGEIHALVGENGAGKSTCLGLIGGRIAPTHGSVTIDGKVLKANPRASREAGVASVHQELAIVPQLSAQANVFLAHPDARLGVLTEARMRAKYVSLCERYGVAAHPDVPAGRLSVAGQQILEVLRAVGSGARAVLFDEPTSALGPSERAALISLIHDLKEQGVAIAFVSHNLEEVTELADRVTVFRDGQMTRQFGRGSFTKEDLIVAMVGDELAARPKLVAAKPVLREEEPIMKVRELGIRNRALHDISFDLRRGEILGIAGLVGSGRSSLLSALAGAQLYARGQLTVDGRRARRWPRTPAEARRLGLSLLPEDRKRQGLVLTRSAGENVMLANLRDAASAGVISKARLRTLAAEASRPFGFDSARLTTIARNLSGGNQQKLMLARWASAMPKVLLVDEPTRGIDVGAKADILRYLEELARGGMSLIVVSSEIEEVLAISDRILVMAKGANVAELDNVNRDMTVNDILPIAFGLAQDGEGATGATRDR